MNPPADSAAKTEPLLADSVTHLDAAAAGRAVVCGSHGGTYVAVFAARLGVAAIVLNDAGVGREEAGIAGLALLEQAGVAAAAVDHDSARIGDARDTLTRGRLSHANRQAEELGCAVGMAVAEAVPRLVAARASQSRSLPALGEASFELAPPPAAVWGLDSIALVGTGQREAVVMSGSHGGLLGGRPAAALKHDVRAAVFNDAGCGIDAAGLGRLGALDQRAIPAAAVDAFSARIGDARSTYEDGVLSAVNETAAALRATPGIPAREFAGLVHERSVDGR